MGKMILYADDDQDDIDILSGSIHAIDAEAEVVSVENGVKAIEYLQKAERDPSAMPNVIVLDINMPYLDGKQTLQQIKASKSLGSIPVFIFTTSANPNDQLFFKKFNSEMITKPTDPAELAHIASHILSYCKDSPLTP
jgi:CheY-like chemotaxis protein